MHLKHSDNAAGNHFPSACICCNLTLDNACTDVPQPPHWCVTLEQTYWRNGRKASQENSWNSNMAGAPNNIHAWKDIETMLMHSHRKELLVYVVLGRRTCSRQLFFFFLEEKDQIWNKIWMETCSAHVVSDCWPNSLQTPKWLNLLMEMHQNCM